MRKIVILMLVLMVCACNKGSHYAIEDKIVSDVIPEEESYRTVYNDTVTDRRGKIENGTLTYSHNAWQSVGKTYFLDYNPVEFDVKTTHDLKNKEEDKKGKAVSDEETISYELRPKRTGVFTVCEVEAYHGKEIRRIKHIIKVKSNEKKASSKK